MKETYTEQRFNTVDRLAEAAGDFIGKLIVHSPRLNAAYKKYQVRSLENIPRSIGGDSAVWLSDAQKARGRAADFAQVDKDIRG